jgi:hypothetical protein
MRRQERRRDTIVITLSGALKSAPGCLNKDGQLRLVGKSVSVIDTGIPAVIADQVITMYLSDNFVRDLSGMGLLRNLRAASLNNNCLRYLEDLQPLCRATRLEKLSCEGNIVAKMPYYRQHVICLCPSLTKLDDVVIDKGERAAAAAEQHRFVSFYDRLRENELRNAIIVHISKVMAYHIEYRKEILGKFRYNCIFCSCSASPVKYTFCLV